MVEVITFEELIKRLENYYHQELHIQHTWSPDHQHWKDKPDGIYWQTVLRHYDVETRRWSDIGHHVTLLPDGTFVTGRDFARNPASIPGYNDYAFAVSMLGNFDRGHDVLDGKQRQTMVELGRWFDKRGKPIRFHPDNSGKDSAGTSMDQKVFIQEVKASQTQVLLKRDMKGEKVKKLQQDLIQLGYGEYLGQWGADGIYGPATENAVTQFQKDYSLKVDGIAGPETLGKITSLLQNQTGGEDWPQISDRLSRIKVKLDTAAQKIEQLRTTISQEQSDLHAISNLAGQLAKDNG